LNFLTDLFTFGHAAALLGCGSALFWGGGDFYGGMGVRAAGGTMRASLKVILLAHAVSLVLIAGLALTLNMPFPHGPALYWGLASGAATALGLMWFYVALSEGHMGPAAAISGLLSAGIPAFVGMLFQGAPGLLQGIGFVAAAASIWLIAAGTPGDRVTRRTLTLSVLAGVSFGIYFIGLRMANSIGVLWAMAATRMGSVTVTSIALTVMTLFARAGVKEPSFNRRAVRFAMMTVLLDTAGNMMFIAATRAGRRRRRPRLALSGVDHFAGRVAAARASHRPPALGHGPRPRRRGDDHAVA